MKIRTLFLKLAVVLAALGVLLGAIFLFWRIPVALGTVVHQLMVTGLLGLGIYIIVLSFLVGCYFAWQLLRCVDLNTAFTTQAVHRLAQLKWAVFAISSGLILTLPGNYAATQITDAPGLLAMGLLLLGVSLVVTVFLAILQRLWASALSYKEENDLTV